MRFISACIVFLLVGFTGTAFAAQALDSSSGSPFDYAQPLLDAVVHGHFWMAAAVAVMMAVALVRPRLPEKYRTGKLGDVIAIGFAFVFAFAGAVFTALSAEGIVMSGAIALAALKVAIGAAGGFGILHKVAAFVVETKFYNEHVPDWLKTVLAYVLKAIGSSAVTKAEAAGEAAVKADPPKGMSGGEDIVEVE